MPLMGKLYTVLWEIVKFPPSFRPFFYPMVCFSACFYAFLPHFSFFLPLLLLSFSAFTIFKLFLTALCKMSRRRYNEKYGKALYFLPASGNLSRMYSVSGYPAAVTRLLCHEHRLYRSRYFYGAYAESGFFCCLQLPLETGRLCQGGDLCFLRSKYL